MGITMQELTAIEAVEYLKEVEDIEAADEIKKLITDHPQLENTRMGELGESYDLPKANWRGTEHAFGYIEQGPGQLLKIEPAASITPDDSLKGQRVNISLGSLYTMNYPGGGIHNVLMNFKCKHASKDDNETVPIEFQQKFISKEGQGAGNLGSYIFNGLRVPVDGLQFEVQTINVSNQNDQKALSVLESDTIKDGLKLFDASFSTLKPFTKMANGVLNMVLNRNNNKMVQQFNIGFAFKNSAVHLARLRPGSYVVAQAKSNLLPWKEWVFRKDTGLIVNKNDNNTRLNVNHLTINIIRAD